MKRNLGLLYTLPVTAWISFFFVIPLGIIFLYSFMEKGLYGGVVYRFSLAAYQALFNRAFIQVTFSTLWISLVSTTLTVLIALPCSYFIARSAHKTFFLFLVIIPFWTNFLIRIYAWIAILGNNGFLNNLLLQLGLTDSYVQFLYTKYAVIVVLVYTYLPFAILPLYATIEKFDFSLLEAAQDLGASKSQAMRKVLIPNIKGGLVTAVLFTFIPAFGAYAVPQLVGGSDSYMLGNIIARELTVTRNWPLSSAISLVITLVTTLCVLLLLRLNAAKERKNRARG